MNKNIIIALDVDSIATAKKIINETKDLVWGYKVGYRLFYKYIFSTELLKLFEEAGNVFLDLKFHDIPATVSGAIGSIKELNPQMITVHASGGRAMIKEAVAARRLAWTNPGTGPKILAVTILTSIGKDGWKYMYPGTSMDDGFLSLLNESIAGGSNGVVCSGWEVGYVKNRYPNLLTVVPGIRPVKSFDDQVRIITPKQAIERGADFIVIGRPIIGEPDCRKATLDIINSM